MKWFVILMLSVLAASVFPNDSVHARPRYQTEFHAKYRDNVAAVQAKCQTCHIGKPAGKVWNGYGIAVGKALRGARNVKDAEEIIKAFEKVEGEKSAIDGKTFGDLLKDGKLPGQLPEK